MIKPFTARGGKETKMELDTIPSTCQFNMVLLDNMNFNKFFIISMLSDCFEMVANRKKKKYNKNESLLRLTKN